MQQGSSARARSLATIIASVLLLMCFAQISLRKHMSELDSVDKDRSNEEKQNSRELKIKDRKARPVVEAGERGTDDDFPGQDDERTLNEKHAAWGKLNQRRKPPGDQEQKLEVGVDALEKTNHEREADEKDIETSHAEAKTSRSSTRKRTKLELSTKQQTVDDDDGNVADKDGGVRRVIPHVKSRSRPHVEEEKGAEVTDHLNSSPVTAHSFLKSRPSVGGNKDHIKWGAFGGESDGRTPSCEDSSCHQPHCMANLDNDGKCETSPYFKKDQPVVPFPEGVHTNENICLDHLPFGHPPQLSSDGRGSAITSVAEKRRRKRAEEKKKPSSHDDVQEAQHGQDKRTPEEEEERIINDFKAITGHGFDTWYDWSAKCHAPHSNSPDGSLLARHEGDQKVFKIYNGCIRPIGGELLAYKGPMQVTKFDGGDEIEPLLGRDSGTLTHFRSFLSHAREMNHAERHEQHFSRKTSVLPNHDDQDKNNGEDGGIHDDGSFGPCFLDTKLLLMPVLMRSHNPGHCFHRHASLNWIRQHVWPEAHPKETTTAFVMSDPQWSDFGVTGHVQFLGVESGSHFQFFTHGDKDILEKLLPEEMRAHHAAQRPICFREMAVYQTCTHADCKKAKSTAHHPEIFPLYHHRSNAILQAFNDRLRECAGIEGGRRAEPNRKSPLILLATRTGGRRWQLAPQIVYLVGRHLKETYQQSSLKPRFRVHEMHSSTASTLAKLYHEVDIVIGPYGAGLFYGVFMPPGAVAIEINFDLFKCSGATGINVNANAHCDYGGNFIISNVNHVVASLKSISEREARPGEIQHDVAPALVSNLLDNALCTVSKERDTRILANAASQSKLGCDSISQGQVDEWEKEYLRESSGDFLKMHIRTRNIFPVPSRLGSWSHQAIAIAGALHQMRSSSHPGRVLLTSPCGRTAGILAEVAVLAGYCYKTTKVFFMKVSGRTSTCPTEEEDGSQQVRQLSLRLHDVTWERVSGDCLMPRANRGAAMGRSNARGMEEQNEGEPQQGTRSRRGAAGYDRLERRSGVVRSPAASSSKSCGTKFDIIFASSDTSQTDHDYLRSNAKHFITLDPLSTEEW